MRKDSAPAEKILWSRLRNGQLNGLKFRRQHPLGNYVADFYCSSAHLVIELDGDSHATRGPYDEQRTRWLVNEGIRVVRFLNTDVMDNIDAVLEEILRGCLGAGDAVSPATFTPHPGPLPQGGEGVDANA